MSAVVLTELTPGSDILCAQPKFKFSLAVDPSVGGRSVVNVPYLNVDGSHKNIFINPASICLVLPSASRLFVYGAPATTKFSSVLIDNESPNLPVLSLPAVVVSVDCVWKSVPASVEDLNKKCISPCPLPGADAITVLPSLRATILYPKS